MGGERLSRPPRFQRLGAYDLHCLRVETPARPVNVGFLAVLDANALAENGRRLPIADVRREINARLAGVPALRRVVYRPGLLAGRPLWVDDPAFDVTHHVVPVELPAPADEPALLALVDRLVAEPLDRSRPLWRLWVVDGLPRDRVAVLMAVHHALADGLTAMRLARSLLEGPVGSGPAPASGASARPPAWGELVIDNLASTLRAALRMSQPATWRLVAGVLRSSTRTMAQARRAPRMKLNGPIGGRRRTALVRLDLAEVKRVANRHDAGANDVVLTLVAAGVRDLLVARGESVEGLRPRAGVTVALFGRGRQQAPGNKIGTYVIPLPLQPAGAVDRLALIARERAHAVRNQTAALEPLVRAWFARFALVRRAMANQQYINLAETYVPGPPGQIETLGGRVVDLVPIAPLSGNLGLSFVALSYARRLVITIRADADQFPDLDLLVSGMERTWRALADASVAAVRGTAPAEAT